jgi:diguanylate cyclase (GGDEF)-like protein/PAS domain S-box-containing protein
VIFDLDWQVLSANHQVSELLGYSHAELLANPGFIYDNPEKPNEFIEYRKRVISGKSLPNFEDRILRKDGSYVPVEMSMALVHDQTGEPRHIQCIMRDITERKVYQDRLEKQALYDPLTNLPNRVLIEDHFQQVNMNQNQSLVAVLFLDLDNFKWVNDEFGHAVGDYVLRELGKRLQSSLRDSDIVARLGGDEFVIILENIRSKADVSKVAEKLLKKISRPILVENQSIEITASIGINLADSPEMGYVELLKNSDFAMYQVKDSGKNDYRFFNPE